MALVRAAGKRHLAAPLATGSGVRQRGADARACAAAVALLLVLIIKVKLHAFVALVLVSTLTALAAGILVAFAAMHALVPPHPGPVAAAEALDADIGLTLLIGIPVAIVSWDVGVLLVSPFMGDRVHVDIPEFLMLLGNTTVECAPTLTSRGSGW